MSVFLTDFEGIFKIRLSEMVETLIKALAI